MSTSNRSPDADFRESLPEELRELDRELSTIRIEERPSFAPELKRELARSWQARGGARAPRARPWARILIAASVATLMIAGVSVPSARAAIYQIVRTVASEAFPGLIPPEPEVRLPEIEVQEAPPVVEESRTDLVVSPVNVSDETPDAEPDLPTIPAVEITLPRLVSRKEATEIVAAHYPEELQEKGVEGSVKLLFWVGTHGSPENIQMRESSGDPRLDYAAMRAARGFQFIPATRNGVAVGTWVEVEVHFFAFSGVGIIGSDSLESMS